MKTVKTALTKLKHQIEKEFNPNAVFLKTITLSNILDEIDIIYLQIDKLIEITNPIEITFFKRKTLKIINNISRLTIKSEWKNNEEVRFIGYLIDLKRLVKQTYLLEVKGELRSEKERQSIAADIQEMRKNLTEHIALEQQLIKDKSEFEHLKKSLITLQNDYEEAEDQVSDIAKWHEKISPLNDEIYDFAETAKNNLNKITTLATTAENAKPKIEQYNKEIEDMIKLFQKQKNEIQEIIEDANRASMAGSFKKQKDDINCKMWQTDIILITSLLGVAGISYWGFSSSFSIENNLLNWSQFLAKSLITLPLLIIAWIKAKERAYLFRLREDYAYKYSSAMAFEGYRKQVQEQSPELEEQLLQIAVDNLGSNPTKVFDKDLKSTPLETIIDGVGKRVDKAFDGLKGQVQDIPQKTKELIDE